MLTSNNINPLEAHPAEVALTLKGQPQGQALPQASKFSELFASMYGNSEADNGDAADGAMPLTLPKEMAMAVEDYVDAVDIEEGVAELANIVDSAVQVQTTLTAINTENAEPVKQIDSEFLPANGLGLATATVKKELKPIDLESIVKQSPVLTTTEVNDKQDSVEVINLMQQALTPKSQQGYEQSANLKTLQNQSHANLDKGIKAGLLDQTGSIKGLEVEKAATQPVELDSEQALTTQTANLAVADREPASSVVLSAADIATTKANPQSAVHQNVMTVSEEQVLVAEDVVATDDTEEPNVDIDGLLNTNFIETEDERLAEFGSETKQPKGLVENAAMPNAVTNANSEVVQSALQTRNAEQAAEQQQVNAMATQSSHNSSANNVNSAAAVNASQNSNVANSSNGYSTQWGAANTDTAQQAASSAQNGQANQSGSQQTNQQASQQAFANQQQMMQFQENSKAKLQAVEQQMAVKAVDELAAKADKGTMLGSEFTLGDRRSQLPSGLQSIGVPVKSSQWGQALGQRVVFMANNNVQQARIVLNPENLGPVQLKVHMDKDQQIHVTMTAQHATTREAMENAIPRLKEMLESAGLDLASVDVGDERQFAQGEQDAESNASGLGANHNESDADTADTTEVTTVAATDNIVDYYA